MTPSTPSSPPLLDGSIQIGDVLQSPLKSPPAKAPRKIHEWNNYKFTCQGHDFEFDLPYSHVIIPASHYTKLKADRESLNILKAGTKLKRFVKNASNSLKSYLATALPAVPALALSAASIFIPLVVTAFLQHYGLFEAIGSIENFANSFPSEAYLRKNIMDKATEDMVWLAQELDDKYAYIACDKGKTLATISLYCIFELLRSSLFMSQATRRM